MCERPEKNRCRACFEPGDKVVQETFDDQVGMLLRFSELFRAGEHPALCQKPGPRCYVCHHDGRAAGTPGTDLR